MKRKKGINLNKKLKELNRRNWIIEQCIKIYSYPISKTSFIEMIEEYKKELTPEEIALMKTKLKFPNSIFNNKI